MPEIGEIRKSTEIGGELGTKYNRARLLKWMICRICGRGAWVNFYKKDDTWRCKRCYLATVKGKTSPSWKGGRGISRGYIRIRLSANMTFFSSMAASDGRIFEHRLVMAQKLGRCLHSWEIVHHKNGVKDDNRKENLEIVGGVSEHIKSHSNGYRDGYAKGLIDGREKQIEELRREIKLLQWQLNQIKEARTI